jgi:hypothetical protein
LTLFASTYAVIPVPDMLWPTLLGMVGIAILARRDQIGKA